MRPAGTISLGRALFNSQRSRESDAKSKIATIYKDYLDKASKRLWNSDYTTDYTMIEVSNVLEATLWKDDMERNNVTRGLLL